VFAHETVELGGRRLPEGVTIPAKTNDSETLTGYEVPGCAF
jgi:hypothetical protein